MLSRTLFALALAAICCSALARYGIPGGFTDEEPADEHVKSLVARLGQKLRAELGSAGATQVKEIEPISFISQVVAGTNYHVKVSDSLTISSSNQFNLIDDVQTNFVKK